MKPPKCDCLPKTINFEEPVPYYDRLGKASSIKDLREHFENRWYLSGKQIKIKKLYHTQNRGVTSEGCSITNWILRREEKEERCLILAKKRDYHFCQFAWIVMAIVIWEGISDMVANDLYAAFVNNGDQFTPPSPTKSEFNKRTCACRGKMHQETCGVSYTVGCSYDMYFDTCKFAKSKNPEKFLQLNEEDPIIEKQIQTLATNLASMFKFVAPIPYQNQIEFEEDGLECRLGNKPGRPWSGAALFIDNSEHPHVDSNTLKNGCTTVVSLTKHRGFDIPEDEQLYVFPDYILDNSEEFGNKKKQQEKVVNKNVANVREPIMPKKTRLDPVMYDSEVNPTKVNTNNKQQTRNCQQSCQSFNSPSVIYEFEYDPTSVEEPLFELVSTDLGSLEDDNICMGGVGISLSHGSLLFVCGANEVHAKTALKKPNRLDPNSISLEFYLQKNLNFRHHGREEIRGKIFEKCVEEQTAIKDKLKVVHPNFNELSEETNRRKRNSSESSENKANTKLISIIKDELRATNTYEPNLLESKIVKEDCKLISILKDEVKSENYKKPNLLGNKIVKADSKLVSIIKDELKAKNYKKPSLFESTVVKANNKLVSIIKDELKAKNYKKPSLFESEIVKNDNKLVSIIKDELKARNYKKPNSLQKKIIKTDLKFVSVEDHLKARNYKKPNSLPKKIIKTELKFVSVEDDLKATNQKKRRCRVPTTSRVLEKLRKSKILRKSGKYCEVRN